MSSVICVFRDSGLRSRDPGLRSVQRFGSSVLGIRVFVSNLRSRAAMISLRLRIRLSSDDVFQEISARDRAVEPSSDSKVIPRRARPGSSVQGGEGRVWG